MRTRLRVAVLLAALVVTVAGCTASPEPTSPAGATRVVHDVDGSPVTVPTHPVRIVTLSEPTLDAVLALGLQPVGTVSGRGQSGPPAYLRDELHDVPVLGAVAQPNYEAIGRAEPDLILVDGTSVNNNAQALETLRHIAPTVYAGYAGGDWRTTFTNVADAVGRADQGAQVLATYDTHVAEVRGRLAAAGYDDKTFSIVRWQGTSAALILPDLPPGQALTDLGLHRPPGQDQPGRGHAEPVSLENLATIDADYMFFGTLGGSSVGNPQAGGTVDEAASAQALEQAVTTPGFTSLTAYRLQHIVPVDGSRWTSTGGPLLMTAIVDDVERALLPAS